MKIPEVENMGEPMIITKTYHYVCLKCGHDFLYKYNIPIECPKCTVVKSPILYSGGCGKNIDIRV